VPPKLRLTFNELHGIISQDRESSSTLSELIDIITGDFPSVIGSKGVRCLFLKEYARIASPE
jgi:hypothetical protein